MNNSDSSYIFGGGRRGSALAYALIIMLALLGFASLAVDYGKVTMARQELQIAADASARYAVTLLSQGNTAVRSGAAAVALQNYCAGAAVVLDTTNDVEFGTWDSTAHTFTVLSGTTGANAVRITARRLASRGQGIPLMFAIVLGRQYCDVKISTIATIATVSSNYGFVGVDSLDMVGNSDSDSYDSSQGAYSTGTRHLSGNVASNGQITLKSNTKIWGDARPGAGQIVDFSGNAAVSGSTASLTTALSYPNVDASTAASSNNNSNIASQFISNGDLSVGSNQSLSLSAGTYYFNDVTINGNATLSITGAVTLYVTGKFTMSGNSVTQQNSPTNFKVRVANSGAVKLNGNSDLYADLYAPQSAITVSGNGDLFGSAIGKTLKVSGNGSVHRDESLTIGGGSGAAAISSVK